MKINLKNLHDGINEIPHEHTAASLNLSDQEEAEIFVNPIKTKATINWVSEQYFMSIAIATRASFTCDRCLTKFVQPVHEEFRLIYAITEAPSGKEVEDDEFRWLPRDTKEIDITADIREALLLMIPMKTVCSEECKGLCPYCGTNLNTDPCTCHAQQIDPRWDALKKLRTT